MSYEIRVKNGLYEISFYDEPNYCYALEMEPFSMEGLLCKGAWLILLFAVWSIPDRKAIDIALKFAKKHEGKFNLGVRPFEDPAENSSWCLGLTGEFGSPIWLYYESGILKDKWIGFYSELELEEKVGVS